MVAINNEELARQPGGTELNLITRWHISIPFFEEYNSQ